MWMSGAEPCLARDAELVAGHWPLDELSTKEFDELLGAGEGAARDAPRDVGGAGGAIAAAPEALGGALGPALEPLLEPAAAPGLGSGLAPVPAPAPVFAYDQPAFPSFDQSCYASHLYAPHRIAKFIAADRRRSIANGDIKSLMLLMQEQELFAASDPLAATLPQHNSAMSPLSSNSSSLSPVPRPWDVQPNVFDSEDSAFALTDWSDIRFAERTGNSTTPFQDPAPGPDMFYNDCVKPKLQPAYAMRGSSALPPAPVTRVADLAARAKRNSTPVVSSTKPIRNIVREANGIMPKTRGRKPSLIPDASKQFACEYCSRRFKRQEHLKRHVRSLHIAERPYNCHICSKNFSRNDNLNQHVKTHLNAISKNQAASPTKISPRSKRKSTA